MLNKLLSPVQAGSALLKNRVVMAPLTRSRAGQPGDGHRTIATTTPISKQKVCQL